MVEENSNPNLVSDSSSALKNANLQGSVVLTLAQLPERALLDETALAGALKISKRTVRRMVGRYELPPPIRLAGRSTWQAGRVLAWLEEMAEAKEKSARTEAQKFRRLS